jgi:hypothetical protein
MRVLAKYQFSSTKRRLLLFLFLVTVVQARAGDYFFVADGTHLVIAEKTKLVLESETIQLDTEVAGNGELVLAGKRKQWVHGGSALVCSNLVLRNADSVELLTTTYIKNSLHIESGTLTLKNADLIIGAEGRLILASGAAIKETSGGKLQIRMKFIPKGDSSLVMAFVPFCFLITSGKVADLKLSEALSKDACTFSQYQGIHYKSVYLDTLLPPPKD